jgi:hypothetical protein
MNEQLRDELWDLFPNLIFYDSPVLDSAIIGLAMVNDNDSENWCVVYSEQQVICDLMKDFGIDLDDVEDSAELDAIEYYDFNILGSYLGLNTPVFYSENPDNHDGFDEYKRFSDVYYFPIQIKDVNKFEEISEFMKAKNTIFFVPLSEVQNIKNLL